MRLGLFLTVLWIMYLTMGLVDHMITNTSNGLSYGNYNVCYNEQNQADTDCPNNNSTTSTAAIWSIVVQPQNWSASAMLKLFFTIFGITSAIAIAGAILTRSDIYVLAPIAGVWLLLGGITLVPLYSFVTRNIGVFACTPGGSCLEAQIIAGATVGVLSLMYVMTVVEWWFWRPTTQ